MSMTREEIFDIAQCVWPIYEISKVQNAKRVFAFAEALLKAQKARETHLTRAEYSDLISYMQEMVDDEPRNKDVQGWNPIIDKLKLQREALYDK